MSSFPQQQEWDKHWDGFDHRRSPVGFISRLVRQLIFQRAVRHYAERYFPAEGIFIEFGCGTAESSALIPKRKRTLVGLDFSSVALAEAQRLSSQQRLVCGDLLSLPFRDASVSGGWNLGVMEHFEIKDLTRVFTELRRVLKPGGTLIFFWPTEHNSSRLILGPIEVLKSRLNGKEFRFFPAEVSRLRSKRQAKELLESAGFRPVALDFSLRTAFIHMVVVAQSAAQ